MAKSTCLLALFVAIVVCTEAIRIDPHRVPSPKSGKHFPSIRKNDPRCKGKENGLYPNKNDCTKYLKCVNGDSKERKCPENFKFDSIRYCVPPEDNPDCGKPTQHGPVDVDWKCPTTWGIYPVEGDCHKYIVCIDSIPDMRNCPSNYFYRDLNSGCVPGHKCPNQASEESVCKKANELLPDEKNFRRFIKCVNFQALKKECPAGTAFNPTKHRCTKEHLKERRNDIKNVGTDE